MKPIKVYLQYPWRFPDSPYYKYLVENPPKNIEYLNAEKQKGAIINKKKFFLSNKLKNNIRKMTNFFGFSFPNAHLTKTKKIFDLIHCAHCMSLNKNKLWVADIESEFQIYVGNKTKFGKLFAEKILLRKNCRKIMPWTKTTADKIIKEFPKIKNKVEVVYPAVPIQKIKRKKHDKINFLFTARYFDAKGGSEAVEVLDYLTKKYKGVNGIVNSNVSEDILKKYSQNKKMKFYKLIPQKKLFEIYSISDILVYPGYSDSFGFAMLEAMSFGIPTITVDGVARKEIIEDEKTGYVLDRPEIKWKKGKCLIDKRELLINEMIEKSEILIKNKKLLKKMSENCIKTIESGKFSIKERNKKLKKIYEEAIK